MKTKVTIIGSGAMGTAMASVLTDTKKCDVTIYGIDNDELSNLKKGSNPKYFSNLKFPNFNTTNNIEEALSNSSYVLISVPSQFLEQVFKEILIHLKNQVIINATKGFYGESDFSSHVGIVNELKKNDLDIDVISLSGPSHAEEIVLKKPTAISLIGNSQRTLQEVKSLIETNYFRCQIEKDILGAFVGSIYKNILAIGSGLLNGLGYGINTLSAYLTYGFQEMALFNKFYGGKPETLFGLVAFGDLLVTSFSDLSRNFSFGKMLATHQDNKDGLNLTIEGITAIEHVSKIAKNNNIILPIVNKLREIIFGNGDSRKFIEAIWN